MTGQIALEQAEHRQQRFACQVGLPLPVWRCFFRVIFVMFLVHVVRPTLLGGFCFLFCFFPFWPCLQKFLGQGWNLCHGRDPIHCRDKAMSLTHCATRGLLGDVLIFDFLTKTHPFHLSRKPLRWETLPKVAGQEGSRLRWLMLTSWLWLGQIRTRQETELYLHLIPVFCFPPTRSSLNRVK